MADLFDRPAIRAFQQNRGLIDCWLFAEMLAGRGVK
jgi:hypothetical protein